MGNKKTPNIEANVISIKEFFNLGSFDIPHYQRAYSWTENEVETLIGDLYDAFKRNQHSTYLLGSITTIQESLIGDRFEILDGQQRLTTLSLIIKLIFDNLAIDEFELKTESKKILFDNNSRLRLTQGRESDKSQFRLIMLNEGQKKDHRLTKNYELIQQYSNRFCQIDFIKFFLNSVVFVHVNTHTIENAYQIFETLNDRHRALQKIDLIRNRLFHSMKDHQIEEACNHWDVLYKKVSLITNGKSADTHLQSMFTIYLQTILGIWIETKDLFIEIKSLLEKYKNNSEYPYQLFFEIQNSFDIYVDIYRPGDSVGRISSTLNNPTIRAIKKIKDLKISHAILFALFDLLSRESKLTSDKYPILENIIFNLVHFIQRTKILGNIPTTKYGKELNILAREIINLKSIKQLDDKWFLQSLKKIDSNNKSIIANENFIQKLANTDIKSDVAKSVLIDIHNDQQRDANEEQLTKTNDIHVEYICPQKLNKSWKHSFSIQEHEYHVNKLGNYVLLSETKDKKVSNQLQSFDDKKQGYKKSCFRTTQNLASQKVWQQQQIKNRTEQLAKNITNILSIKGV